MMLNRFPEELLDQSIQARYQYFDNLLVLHPHFIEARDAIWNALHDVRPGELINIIGPAGVGKTVLLSWIKQQLLTEALPGLFSDLGRIPFIAVDGIPPTTSSFDWNDFMVRCLLLLNEPLIEEKEIPYIVSANQRRTVRHYIRNDHFSPQLLRALEQSLYYRRVSTFIVDDAVYVGTMYWKERLIDRFRSIRLMMQKTGTTWLLAGTYDLLELMTKMDLAGWESVDVHVQRYQLNDGEDHLEFQSTLLTFQEYLPVFIEYDFVQHAEYLYSGCIGCVGLLKGWLSRALAVALEDGSNILRFKHLQQAILPSAKLEKLIDEIEQGEKVFMQWNNQREHSLKKFQPQQAICSKKSRKGVIERNPVRDRVGE